MDAKIEKLKNRFVKCGDELSELDAIHAMDTLNDLVKTHNQISEEAKILLQEVEEISDNVQELMSLQRRNYEILIALLNAVTINNDDINQEELFQKEQAQA